MEHRHNQKEGQENDQISVQENENWKGMAEMECYQVMTESEILEKCN